jgi:hypothetical protein
MPAAATGFERAASLRRTERADAMRRALWRWLLVALDRLAPPPSRFHRDAELPAEWFKYPPV